MRSLLSLCLFSLMMGLNVIAVQAQTLPADLNQDSVVNADDVLLFRYWMHENNQSADVNNDGTVDERDLFRFAEEWQQQESSGAPIIPNPADVSPALEPSGVETFYERNRFLFEADTPLVINADPDAVDPEEAAIVRGEVYDRNGQPLAGATIEIHGQSELGQTQSRADGGFDIMVNGGRTVTVAFSLDGYLPVQRTIQPPTQDYFVMEEVCLTPLDEAVTTIEAGSSDVQVAEGSVVTDADGTRQACLMFEPGTNAQMVMENGETQPLSTMNVRATEYTVGEDGPLAMPAELPANVGYTYCVEFSVDEAMQAGAASVAFDQPVAFYLENFLDFPAGGVVPMGFYDRQQATWTASRNGRVITFLGSDDAGLALLDLSGNGEADSVEELLAAGITEDERRRLAGMYSEGQSLWRVEVEHFTPWDCNWPYGPPEDSEPPPLDLDLDDEEQPDEEECENAGSIIDPFRMTLEERIELAGSDMDLYYNSETMAGRNTSNAATIRISSDTVPASLLGIRLELSIAGQRIVETFSPAPNLTYEFEWDGQDAYGRDLQGSQKLSVRLGYEYRAVYMEPNEFENSFGRFSGRPMEANEARQSFTVWSQDRAELGNFDAGGIGLGGWRLTGHHIYDPLSQTVYFGDGEQRNLGQLNRVIETVVGRGPWFTNPDFDPANPPIQFGESQAGLPATEAYLFAPINDLGFSPDGRLHFFHFNFGQPEMLWVDEEGVLQQLLLSEGLITDYSSVLFDFEFGPDGSLYVLSHLDFFAGVIHRQFPDGRVERVAGTAFEFDFLDPNVEIIDNTPATEARLLLPTGFDVTDRGEIYISGAFGIARVAADGRISTMAGQGSENSGFSGDGGPAEDAQVDTPMDVELGADGSVYFADHGNRRIREITPDGIIQTIAGNGRFADDPFSGEGGLATQAALGDVQGIEVDENGFVYMAMMDQNVVRRITPDGRIETIAGNGSSGYEGDGGSAVNASLGGPLAVAVHPERGVFVADAENASIRRIGSAIESVGFDQNVVPSSDRELEYLFNYRGQHTETRSLLTGAPIYQFLYDEAGRLREIVDDQGRRLVLERDGEGDLRAITSPFSQRTEIALNDEGYIATVTDPLGQQSNIEYDEDGLMTQFTDFRGIANQYAYDDQGRLVRKTDSQGRVTSLERREIEHGYEVVYTEPLGNQTVYQSTRMEDGSRSLSILRPNNNLIQQTTLPDGSQMSVTEDGMTVTQSYAGDPVYGIVTPVLAEMTMSTPSGLSVSMGQQRSLIRNASGEVTALRDALRVNDATTTSTYSFGANILEVTYPTGLQSAYALNEHAQPIELRPDTRFEAMQMQYEDINDIASITFGGGTWTFSLNEFGALGPVEDPLGNVIEYQTNALGQMTGYTLPSGRQYSFGRDALGNIEAITLPGGQQYSLGYNALSQQSTTTMPDGAEFAVAHNDNGRVVERTLPSGRAIEYGYDDGQRPTQEAYPEATIDFVYDNPSDRPDAIIRLDAAGEEQLRETFAYDGSLITGIEWTGEIAGSIDYTYGNDFRPASIAINDAINIPLQRNEGSDIMQKGPFAYQRDGFMEAPSQITDGAMTIDYEYDEYGRLQRRTHSVNGTTFYILELQYNAAGQVSQQNETLLGNQEGAEFAYDVDGQLVEVQRDGAVAETYAYDLNGNRAEGAYNDRGHLTEWQGASLTWNADGFLEAYGSETFTYSTQGELLQATTAAGGTIDYLYDHFGRLRARTEGSTTTQFIYTNLELPYLLHAAVTSDGDQTVYYYDDGGILYAFERNGEWFYVGSTLTGTPRVVVDASGNLVKQIDYTAFGEVTADSAPDTPIWVGYSGGLYDAATGLVRFGQRDYAPWLGRWTAEDPIQFESGELNLYAYAGNDPINFRDENGLFRSYASKAWKWAKSFWETKDKVEKAKKAYDTGKKVNETLESDKSDPEQAKDLMECMLDWVPWWGAEAGKEALDFQGFNPTDKRRDIGRAKERLVNDACPECADLL